MVLGNHTAVLNSRKCLGECEIGIKYLCEVTKVSLNACIIIIECFYRIKTYQQYKDMLLLSNYIMCKKTQVIKR